MKSFLFNKIRNCDIVLCNLNDSIDSPETCVEIQYAVDNYIPVIGYGRKNAFSWAVNVDCDVVFDTMEEAVAYIKKFYLASSAPLEVG